jgi:hypothetical protein
MQLGPFEAEYLAHTSTAFDERCEERPPSEVPPCAGKQPGALGLAVDVNRPLTIRRRFVLLA